MYLIILKVLQLFGSFWKYWVYFDYCQCLWRYFGCLEVLGVLDGFDVFRAILIFFLKVYFGYFKSF